MTNNVLAHEQATLAMPLPRLHEGRFSSCACITDDALYASTGIRIAFTQRTGGTSSAPFDSLNLGGHVGDDPACVKRNREVLFEALGAEGVFCIQPNQVHGDTLVLCDEESDLDACAGLAAEGADGVVVSRADTAALLCFADCVPVILAAPTGAFAVVHAGWRGVVSRIAEKALKALCAAENVDTSSVNVYIGAHIRSCHFEVGEDVASLFAEQFGEQVVNDRRFVDMAFALSSGLVSCGVDARRIADAGICTVCDGGARYYSYRATGGRCGRHAAVAFRASKNERRACPCL